MAARTDYFGNRVTTISIFEPHDLLTVRASSIVEVTPRQEELGLSPAWEETREVLATQPDDECLAAYEFACDSPFVIRGTELAEYARPTFTAGRPLLDALLELMARIRAEFRYEPKSTTIDTPVLEVLHKRAGVCQDFAHLMIGALRSLGLAARYVSGYLRSGEDYHGSEASHAWVAAFVPGTGWVHFDPTNNVMPSDGHVTIGWGRDYGDVTPLRGITRGGGEEAIDVEVRVSPLEA
jgi:transglutaminase-like putative cysteine protease